MLFIEASREFGTKTTQNVLRDQDVKKIAATFHAFKDVEKYARVVSLDEIEKNEFNLNISRYMDTAETAEVLDVETALANLRRAETTRVAAESKLNAYLQELGYGG